MTSAPPFHPVKEEEGGGWMKGRTNIYPRAGTQVEHREMSNTKVFNTEKVFNTAPENEHTRLFNANIVFSTCV